MVVVNSEMGLCMRRNSINMANTATNIAAKFVEIETETVEWRCSDKQQQARLQY